MQAEMNLWKRWEEWKNDFDIDPAGENILCKLATALSDCNYEDFQRTLQDAPGSIWSVPSFDLLLTNGNSAKV